MKIAGVVVLYNPLNNVYKNILTYIKYIKYIDKVYIIDNSDFCNKNIFMDKLDNFKSKIEYIWLGENKGIAKALNIGKEKAQKEKFQFLLTMDQDSNFGEDFPLFLKKIEEYELKLNDSVIISPYHLTNNLEKIKVKKSIEFVDSVMTSGNMINLKLAKLVGDFEEKFFIDEVDHDYCYRIKMKGLKVAILNEIKLKHNLGNVKKYLFFSTTNHSYIRRYYITRNKLYMVKKYPFLKKEYLKIFLKSTLKILLVEKDKLKKIKAIFYGIIDFYYGKTGKLSRKI